MQLENLYTQRAQDFSETASQLESRYNRNSLFRLFIFLAGVGIFLFLFAFTWYWSISFLVLFIVAFGFFVKWHQGIKNQQIHNEYLAKVNQNELTACRHDFSIFDPGTAYTTPEHPYALDLDIFGPHSFFQFANRTSSSIGSRQLANYLLDGADVPEIYQRQEACRELAQKLDWRQGFQALGMVTEDHPAHLLALQKWLAEPTYLYGKKWITAALFLAPIWFIAINYLTFLYFPWQVSLLSIVPQILLLRHFLPAINQTHQQTMAAEKILAYYASMIAHIEEEDFSSEKLKDLKALLVLEKGTASTSVKRLSYIISQLNVRLNAFVILFNLVGLWDIHWVLRLEKWKLEQRDRLPFWFQCLQEMEALLSLATIHYNHPDWVFPQVQDQPQLETQALGHPLIPTEKAITNDFTMPTEAHTKLITGSNMAGKSTFLRTVGLNIVLAMTGAPVCARLMRLPLLQVYTSMRTQDALHESTSSFYAELKRLKVIIEAIDAGKSSQLYHRQPFFLLDEILKGTNSKDRHTGSKALIHQLIKNNGSGLIATHDLELGSMEAQYGGAIENLCMEVAVQNDQLIFDYKLKKGVSQSFNATHLMRNMGIRIEELGE